MRVGSRQCGLGAFAKARGGNVAMMWAILGSLGVALAGLTVDFTRAQILHARLQNAADGAVLAAARGDAQTAEQRLAAAQAYFTAEMGDWATRASFQLTELPDDEIRADVTMPMPMTLARLVRNEDWNLRVRSNAQRSGVNVEVALVLDTTGSMGGQRIADLREAASDLVNTVVRTEQSPYYSKVALVNYSTGVNLGGYATQARGPITPGRSLSAQPLNWLVTTTRTITSIAKAGSCSSSNCRLTVTSNNHGYQNGERVYITGVNGMTQVNNTVFTVANRSTNAFELRNSADTGWVNGSSYGNYSSSGQLRACRTATCEVVFTANNHGFGANDYIYVTGVGGMSGSPAINNPNPVNVNDPALWQVGTVLDANTFSLKGSFAPNYSNYTSGGTAYCLERGCEFVRFVNTSNRVRVLPITNCVSERTGAERYTDVAPSTSYVGRNYARPQNTNAMCPNEVVVPLSSDRNMLNTRIAAMQASGYTAGHIGIAWGWYMVSPNFGYLWPSAERRPAPYNAPETLKIVVLMTDGAFNTGYCNDVISADSSTGGSERVNCNMTNGSPYAQAQSLCTAMKSTGVVVYTVGFGLAGDTTTQNLMRNCATTPSHAYLSENGEQLRMAFQAIAASITQLRITR